MAAVPFAPSLLDSGAGDIQLDIGIRHTVEAGTPKSMTFTFPGLTFGFAGDFSSLADQGGINVTINSMTFLDIGFGTGSGTTFRGFTDTAGFTSLTFTAGLTTNLVGESFMLNNIRTSAGVPVPEPTTLVLLALGLAGIGFRRRQIH